MKDDTQSHQAFSELVDLLADIDERWVSPEWNFHTVDDKVDAYRAVMHTLQWGLVGLFERDPAAPGFRRIANPSRNIMGDNPVRSISIRRCLRITPTGFVARRVARCMFR